MDTGDTGDTEDTEDKTLRKSNTEELVKVCG